MARVFIAMPQHRPMSRYVEKALAEMFEIEGWRPIGLHPRVAGSIFNLKVASEHESELHIMRFDGLIERSQCALFGQWLWEWNHGNKFDYYLRLDEDIEFHPSAIQSMIDADKPIIGGAYAYRAGSSPKSKKSVCKYLLGEVPDKNSILKIFWLNGGFQFFRSDALFKLMEAYPELRYIRRTEGNDKMSQPKPGEILVGRVDKATETYALWTTMIKKLGENPLLLSEDYAICQRAIDIGMEIYLDLKVQLCHWDTHVPEPDDPDDEFIATGYMIGQDPIVVTERNKPWRSSTETISSVV